MKVFFTIGLFGFALIGLYAQPNLALSATASASASSSGAYGPANWNDGIINGATFGWVGTDPNMPVPSYMQFDWTTPQSFDSVVIYNVGSNFAPPNGNGVVFNGTADLEYFDGSQWVYITSFTGQGTYSSSYSLTFSPVTATMFRIVNINTGSNPVNHNPGFDEIEIFLSPQPVPFTDAELSAADTLLDKGSLELHIEARITNLGNQLLDSVEVSYEVSNSVIMANERFNLNLLPGADTVVEMSQPIVLDSLPWALSNESLCVWVSAVADSNSSNDSICISLEPLRAQELKSLELQVYPNPSTGHLSIACQFPIDEILIRSLEGQEVLFHPGFGAFHTEVECKLPAGTYLMQVVGSDDKEVVRITIHP